MKRELAPTNPNKIEIGKKYRFIFLEEELTSLYRISDDPEKQVARALREFGPFQGEIVEVLKVRKGETITFHRYDITKGREYVTLACNGRGISTLWISCDFLYDLESKL